MTKQPPPTRPSSRTCPWCSTQFEAVYRPGRPRIYCRLSCRQRSYERRRGLGVLPPPDRIIMTNTGPLAALPNRFPGYERGYAWGLDTRAHALRPAGITEHGERRLTLCGTLARPVPARSTPQQPNHATHAPTSNEHDPPHEQSTPQPTSQHSDGSSTTPRSKPADHPHTQQHHTHKSFTNSSPRYETRRSYATRTGLQGCSRGCGYRPVVPAGPRQHQSTWPPPQLTVRAVKRSRMWVPVC